MCEYLRFTSRFTCGLLHTWRDGDPMPPQMRMILMNTLNTTEVADLVAELLDANWDFDYSCRKERESKEAGLTYLEKLYKEDQQPAWDRMYAAEQALEGLGIDVREAQRKLDAQRKAA